MAMSDQTAAGRRQFRAALDAQPHELVEPTADEAKNGWTAETLTAYVAEQKAAQTLRIDPSSVLRRKALPKMAHERFSPFRWRRG